MTEMIDLRIQEKLYKNKKFNKDLKNKDAFRF